MSFIENLIRARKTLLGLGAVTGSLCYYNNNIFLKNYLFGHDGNGGDMLKIHTYLTDQEMAHLRYQKRLSWHTTKLEKDQFKSVLPSIHNEELNDMGIKFPEDRYVEYNKRPPHDYYV